MENNGEKMTIAEIKEKNGDAAEKISVKNILVEFNRGTFRKSSIPQELVAGWPNVRKFGNMVCLQVPYYARKIMGDSAKLYPIYCTVTFPVTNPGRIVDFSINAYKKEWKNVDFSKPVCLFNKKTLPEVENAKHYRELTDKLYEYYDDMIKAVMRKEPFERQEEMKELFGKLAEPGLKNAYKAINKNFYSCFMD